MPQRPRIVIRRALAVERDALEGLQWRASLENVGDRDALSANPDAIDLPAAQIEGGGVVVAEIDRVVKGFAAVLSREDGDAELDGLFVEPTAWRQGIGRALVEHCCRVARSDGAVSLHVIGNPHAVAFYHSCGFTTAGTVQTRFGVGLLMRRGL